MMKSPSLHSYTSKDSTGEILQALCNALPPLPSSLRYYDEFEDKVRSIANPQYSSSFELYVSGRKYVLSFANHGDHYQLIFKHVFAFLMAQDLSIGTIYNYLVSAQQLCPEHVATLVESGPSKIGLVWSSLRALSLPVATYLSAKSLLHLLCACGLNGWSTNHRSFLHLSLPLPATDKYKGVRAGDVFLHIDEEALIIRYLDEVVSQLATDKANLIAKEKIVDALMLLCAYQFAMRPIQIAMLEKRDVRFWHDNTTGSVAVHLKFHTAKQRTGKRHPMNRRVKSEWTPLFTYWNKVRDRETSEVSTKFFLMESSHEAARRITALSRLLIGSDELGTATDLRHTAAQRLVDAGASHEELAEFLGHAQTNTGLVYYAASASHAERVNKALGASSIYSRVAKIAQDGFISSAELAALKDDQQVAAVPHGIPISGIGGCQSGQNLCPFNPVTSCYGCRKFMPIRDRSMHEKVLADMREVVKFFIDSSRGGTNSPAYLQLRRTISEIQSVIDDLHGKAE